MKIFGSLVTSATLGIGWLTLLSASAAVYDFSNGDSGTLYAGGGSSLSQVIPDNTRAGVGYSIDFGASGLNIDSVSVSLNLSGGYNGDIYGYLAHGSQIAYLLNPNPAVTGSGFNVTFVVGSGNPIPTGGSGTLTGASYTGVGNLSIFSNTDPFGAWTLYLADLSPGDTSTVNSFSVNVTAVPEPATWAALIAYGAVFGLIRQICVWTRKGRGF